MLDQEKLFLKLCETLKEKGFEHFTLDKTSWWMNRDNRNDALEINAHFSLIFSPEFAKFAWGEENVEFDGKKGLAWKYHLSKLAQYDDRLGYIAEHYLSKL
jgi:hypothetical protein